MMEPFALLDQAEKEHRPVARFALFSGGHDSAANTSVCMEWAESRGLEMSVAHISTGIGIPQTFYYVKRTCKEQGWPLVVYSAEEHGRTYEDLVTEYGFPGPAHHNLMYNQLKQRALRALVRDHKSRRKDFQRRRPKLRCGRAARVSEVMRGFGLSLVASRSHPGVSG